MAYKMNRLPRIPKDFGQGEKKTKAQQLDEKLAAIDKKREESDTPQIRAIRKEIEKAEGAKKAELLFKLKDLQIEAVGC